MTPNPGLLDDPRRRDRYARQIAFEPIGVQGQQRLLEGRVVIFGCGALGSVQANTLVRAGVGFVRLVDSDRVELSRSSTSKRSANSRRRRRATCWPASIPT